MAEGFPKKITKITSIPISIDRYGLYVITITANCKSKKQINANVDEDLRIEIDGIKFREIPPKDKPQYNNIPSSWNGSELKGLPKTIVFVLRLSKGEHILTFSPTQSAFIEKYEIQRIQDTKKFLFDLNQQAEDGDGRPWYTFALIDLPLYSLSADVSISWHFLDGDDVKLIVDGKSKNNNNSIIHRYWIWAATPLILLSGGKREEKSFIENLSSGIHYIEFWADATPTLHTVTLNLGDISTKRIPTLFDPKWTGNFADDTEQMILARAIYGECRDVLYPDEARIAIAWSIRNRVEDERWANTYKEVITQSLQYSSFDETDPNRKLVEDPLKNKSPLDANAWQNAYDIAGKVINSKVIDPTRGSNHYFDSSIKPPYWAKVETYVLTIPNSKNTKSLTFHRL